jgi:hypothetical protein
MNARGEYFIIGYGVRRIGRSAAAESGAYTYLKAGIPNAANLPRADVHLRRCAGMPCTSRN